MNIKKNECHIKSGIYLDNYTENYIMVLKMDF